MKPNVLFLLKGLETGGLEVVTSVLANKFIAEGHGVSVFSFLGGKPSVADRFDGRIKVYQLNDYSNSKENIARLRQVLIEDRISIIINQWGLPLIPIRVAKSAVAGLDVKIISVYHNAPSFNGRIQKIRIALSDVGNPIGSAILHVKMWMFKEVTRRAMRYIYEQSDAFLVLSKGYTDEFMRFTRLKEAPKLHVLTNPVTVVSDDFEYKKENKRNEIIYVGRLDFVQKRVYRVIDTWNYLEDRFADWSLTIVGDGEDRANLENHVKALGLKRVSFEGFRKPDDYYRRASILMLTSDFEGFPLVLPECMSFGVIPVVYDSYAAVGDIIEHGKDGIVVPFHEEGYKADEAAMMVAEIMEDEDKRKQMAIAAIEKSKRYSVDEIYQKWMEIIISLCGNEKV